MKGRLYSRNRRYRFHVTSPYRLFQVRILVRIRWGAATEKAYRLCSRDRVPHARRDKDRIARAHHSTFAIEFYLARAFQDEIKLFWTVREQAAWQATAALQHGAPHAS
jgi:hypothetical protein